MHQSIKLGRIAGIPVGINWSVLVIFWLLMWGLAASLLPADYPGYSRVDYWVAAAAASVIFFASLLAHELGHSILAKRNGVGVSEITLWLFGGVSELEKEALTPGADFRIAAAGPSISILLGAAFIFIGFVLKLLSVPELIAGTTSWLGWINFLLAGFNLVPAAPLDGGRILRSALWHHNGDRTKATITAARAGRAFGYILIGLGILEFAFGDLSGLWPAFLGWFLLVAARSEESAALLRGALTGYKVKDLMSTNPTVVPASTTVEEFTDSYLLSHRFSAYPVADATGQITGLVTLDRIRHVPRHQHAYVTLGELANPIDKVPLAYPQESLPNLLERMAGHRDGRALVIDHTGRLLGIISPSDISRAVQVASLRGNAPIQQ